MLTVEPASAGVRLDRWLSERLTDLSRARLQALIRGGLVRIDGATSKAAHRLRGGERIEIEVPPAVEETLVPEVVPLSIVYEDDHVLVVDKPAGRIAILTRSVGWRPIAASTSPSEARTHPCTTAT